MPRVFVLNDGGHNYRDAERFGEIIFCTDRVIKKTDISQMYRELNGVLGESNAEDFLLVSSLTSLAMVAAGIMGAMHGQLNMLLFDGGQYHSRTLMFDN